MKCTIKINFTYFLCTFKNVATIKFGMTYVACIISVGQHCFKKCPRDLRYILLDYQGPIQLVYPVLLPVLSLSESKHGVGKKDFSDTGQCPQYIIRKKAGYEFIKKWSCFKYAFKLFKLSLAI